MLGTEKDRVYFFLKLKNHRPSTMTKRNRGKQPNDDKNFSVKWHPIFTEAIDDLCFLLSRGYGDTSSLQIVGNRYRLNKRQQSALLRISVGDKEISGRKANEINSSRLENQDIEIDGFNLLILLEGALSGAFIFKCRDRLYRDISSVHGSYKRVVNTENAILTIGDHLKSLKPKSIKWYLDQPVSNSGRLKTRLMELSRTHDYNWEVELVFDPDKVLAKSKNVVVSSDGWILDHTQQWYNLGAEIIEGLEDKSNLLIF